MIQKPVLRAEGECACVVQMARAKIRGNERPSPAQRARHMLVVSTQKKLHWKVPNSRNTEFHYSRGQKRLFSAQGAKCSASGQMPLKGKNSSLSLQSDSETRGPQKSTSCQWAACALAGPPNHRADPKIFHQTPRSLSVVVFQRVTKTLARPSV